MINIYNEISEAIQDIKKELEISELESVMRSERWQSLMTYLSDNIKTEAMGAKTESDVAFNFDKVLVKISEDILLPSGFDGYIPLRERQVDLINDSYTQKISKKGRIDSKYNSLIIEYKKPQSYKTEADFEKAEKQAIEYLNALNREERGDYAALITDGLRYQFIEFTSNGLSIEANKEFNADALNRIIKSIIKLTVKTLDSENLIHDLLNVQHNGSNLINKMTKTIYESLKNMNDSTVVSYESWLDNFGLSHEDASKQQAIEARRADLAKIVDKHDIKQDEEYKILFALQTSTAIVAMLIAYKAVSIVKGRKYEYSLKKMHNIGGRNSRIELYRIASGTISQQTKIHNLLEIGCFSWVFQEEQWSEEIYLAINNIIEVLLKYENMPEITEHTDDIFRELYMAIMPTSVRHSMGEYYTPKWLARNVISDGLRYVPVDRKNHVRILDTAAGSGTFPQQAILMKREIYKDEPKDCALDYILNEVVSIDANILAVILARINYFMAISDLVDSQKTLYIPAFIGDSTVPTTDKISEDGDYFVTYLQDSNGNEIEFRVPRSSVSDTEEFIETFQFLEDISEGAALEDIRAALTKICTDNEQLEEMTQSWYNLQSNDLITPSIVSNIINYFLLCSLGKFDMLVGNPPWVDWKSLPSVHREKIKEACISKNLFSGDGRTGGINLNICALLITISIENWLHSDGVATVLMPQNLLFQQSYEGFRNLKISDNRTLYVQEIVDWEKSGHPFKPVQQLFCTYILSERRQDYFEGIPSRCIKIKKGKKLTNSSLNINSKNFSEYFDIENKILGRTTLQRTAFTYATSKEELKNFQLISGQTDYLGREGVEYYPQELQLFSLIEKNGSGTVELETYQSKRSKYSIPIRRPEIETKYLRPLIKGINISRFHVSDPEYIVAFPYDEKYPKIPLNKAELRKQSPLLFNYYKDNRQYLELQTGYSDSIIGNKSAEYYALARTGYYSHAPWYVIFRDNTKWVSAVIGEIDTAWGGKKTPAFQNHCVSICERPDGKFITEDEAYYISAILNSHIVEDFILSTSDKRTFKIRIPVNIPIFDSKSATHKKLSVLSKQAHKLYDDTEKVEDIRDKIDSLYISLLEEGKDKNNNS
ncbi:TPA: hypothetical protein U1239_001920 [Streptococcus suis]|nr:hypothetical protein [Streptococcus suis]